MSSEYDWTNPHKTSRRFFALPPSKLKPSYKALSYRIFRRDPTSFRREQTRSIHVNLAEIVSLTDNCRITCQLREHGRALRLFEIALVLVRLDHMACRIRNAHHSIILIRGEPT